MSFREKGGERQNLREDKFRNATTSTENSMEEGVEMIWFEERVISALNRTRPLGVVTTTGRTRGKGDASTTVVETWGSVFVPNSELDSVTKFVFGKATVEPT